VLLPKAASTMDITTEIEYILNEIDKYVVFIQERDNVDKKVEELTTRVYANLPNTLILCSSYSANSILMSVVEKLECDLQQYQTIKLEEAQKKIVIFQKKNS
jgi:hypothetical protein